MKYKVVLKKSKEGYSVSELPASAVIANMTTGFWVSQMIGVVAELGIADLLTDGRRNRTSLADNRKCNSM